MSGSALRPLVSIASPLRRSPSWLSFSVRQKPAHDAHPHHPSCDHSSSGAWDLAIFAGGNVLPGCSPCPLDSALHVRAGFRPGNILDVCSLGGGSSDIASTGRGGRKLLGQIP